MVYCTYSLRGLKLQRTAVADALLDAESKLLLQQEGKHYPDLQAVAVEIVHLQQLLQLPLLLLLLLLQHPWESRGAAT